MPKYTIMSGHCQERMWYFSPTGPVSTISSARYNHTPIIVRIPLTTALFLTLCPDFFIFPEGGWRSPHGSTKPNNIQIDDHTSLNPRLGGIIGKTLPPPCTFQTRSISPAPAVAILLPSDGEQAILYTGDRISTVSIRLPVFHSNQSSVHAGAPSKSARCAPS